MNFYNDSSTICSRFLEFFNLLYPIICNAKGLIDSKVPNDKVVMVFSKILSTLHTFIDHDLCIPKGMRSKIYSRHI